mgnify:CR=1 FL=1
MKPIGILNEKRKHARNEAEQALRDADRKERGAKHGKQVQAMNYYGGRNAPTGHARGSINALQRLNQKQDSKAGKENTRVRYVKNHISMGIRDEDGQLTPKAAKTYIAHRKANLQRTREKRQFNQSMGDK